LKCSSQKLGPERFADYTRNLDNSYRELAQLGKRLAIQPATINTIYDQRNLVPVAALSIAKDPSLDVATKRADLKQLAEATRSQIMTALGKEGGEAYLKEGNMDWLTDLEEGNIRVQSEDGSWEYHRVK